MPSASTTQMKRLKVTVEGRVKSDRAVAHAILFDLDHTLWERDVAVRRLVTAQHAEFPALGSVPCEQYVERVMTLEDRGAADKRVLYAQVVQEFGLSPFLADALHTHFWANFKNYFEPAPDAFMVLNALRAAGLKTGIITNGGMAAQDAKIAGLGLAPLMDVILVSEREGVRKPDRAIFQRALDRLGVHPRATWFVGDHPEFDVRGAAEAGLTAVWLRSWADAAPHATHTISALGELLPLLLPESAARIREG
jgi:putative hydrolase of the HAD superfamily